MIVYTLGYELLTPVVNGHASFQKIFEEAYSFLSIELDTTGMLVKNDGVCPQRLFGALVTVHKGRWERIQSHNSSVRGPKDAFLPCHSHIWEV